MLIILQFSILLSNTSKSFSLDRATILTELNKILSPMAAMQTQITEHMEHRISLMASVEQRLKWASGANPTVVEVKKLELLFTNMYLLCLKPTL